MTPFTQDLVMLLAAVGLSLYFFTNRIAAPGRWFFHDTILDRHIPLVPFFVIPYLSLFPYMLATILLLMPTKFAFAFFTCCAIASWSAALVWYVAPAGILRHVEIGADFFSRMIAWLYTHDHENNTFPSSHVFYAIICTYFLSAAFPAYGLIFAVAGLLISISTVLVKQHHVADIIGGMIWAIASIVIANVIAA